ncbi:MAG: aminoacyl-tRNA hydrolase [Alphaproteobacteria bacterium]
MLLVVGLGNPGPGYANTRHNIGFMAVDAIVRRHGFAAPRRGFQGETFEGVVDGEKVLVLKPTTYMNQSGNAVGAAMRFYKLALDHIVVIHDELDLGPGRLKVKTGGGSAGHNGLKSITAHIGPDYRRVRVGIDHPGDKDKVTGYVLNNFAKADSHWIDPLIDAVADAFPLLVKGDDPGFMTRVALLTQPPESTTDEPAKAEPGGDGNGL